VPLFEVDELLIEGFCSVEVKPFGPVHEYDAPLTEPAARLIVLPEHTGELEFREGATGIA